MTNKHSSIHKRLDERNKLCYSTSIQKGGERHDH